MRARPVLLGAAGLLGGLAVWEAVSRLGIVNPMSLPPASTTLVELASELTQRQTWTETIDTLVQIILSVALCLAVAAPLGLAIGRLRRMDAYSRTSIDFLRAVPGLALVPLFVLFAGARPVMVILLASFVAFWPLLTQTIDGARAVEPLTLEMARSYRLGSLRMFAGIVLPSAAPFIVTGLRVSVNVALLVAVGTQLLVGAPGIGQQMAVANANGNGVAVYALSLWAGIIGVALNLALRAAELRVMGWHKAMTEQNGAA